MRDYRCYFFDRDGHIVAVREFRCADDDAAITATAELLVERAPHYGAELWNLRIRIARFPRSVARQ